MAKFRSQMPRIATIRGTYLSEELDKRPNSSSRHFTSRFPLFEASIDILQIDATYWEVACLTVYPRIAPQAATISKVGLL
jgi:hypothetical protein